MLARAHGQHSHQPLPADEVLTAFFLLYFPPSLVPSKQLACSCGRYPHFSCTCSGLPSVLRM